MERSSTLSLRDKSPAERRRILAQAGFVSDDDREIFEQGLEAWSERLNAASENVIAAFPQAWSVATNFVINGKPVVVPMVTEEMTVVAAASKAAKLSLPAGFTVRMAPRCNVGHFCLVNPTGGAHEARRRILETKDEIVALIRAAHDPMAKYGGGLRAMYVDVLKEEDGGRLEIGLKVDTVDAMGAKVVTAMAETAARIICEKTGGETMAAICDNAAPGIGVYAKCAWKAATLTERHLARFLYVCEWAALSPHRAATHNKGIMNGVIAVCQATGQDTRAVYEAVADWSRHTGACKPLSKFSRSANGDLIGRLFLPLHVATVGGGTMGDAARRSFKLLGIDVRQRGSSGRFAEIVGAVGLAQNFAALYQLSSPEGFSATYRRNGGAK